MPSASYSFSWRPNPEWPSYYSGAKEIFKYFRDVVDEEGLAKWMRLSTQVIGCKWDEGRSKWIVKLKKVHGDGDGRKEGEEWTDESDIVLMGVGFVK